MTTLYGIRNCDTVKKARARLAASGIEHDFHDYRTAGVPRDALGRWIDRLGWEALLNRRGTTFRGLPNAEKAGLDRARATALMLAHLSTIRRPVVEHGDALLVGYDPAAWDAAGL